MNYAKKDQQSTFNRAMTLATQSTQTEAESLELRDLLDQLPAPGTDEWFNLAEKYNDI